MPAVRCTDRAQHLAGQRGASREGWRHSDPATVSLRKRADARGCICRAGPPRGGRAESHAAAQGRRRAPAPRRPAKRQRGSTRVRAGCTLPRRFRVSDADSSPPPTSPHLLRLILSRSLPACRAGALSHLLGGEATEAAKTEKSLLDAGGVHILVDCLQEPSTRRRHRAAPDDGRPRTAPSATPSPNGAFPRSRQCELTAARHCAFEILHSLVAKEPAAVAAVEAGVIKPAIAALEAHRCAPEEMQTASACEAALAVLAGVSRSETGRHRVRITRLRPALRPHLSVRACAGRIGRFPGDFASGPRCLSQGSGGRWCSAAACGGGGGGRGGIKGGGGGEGC